MMQALRGIITWRVTHVSAALVLAVLLSGCDMGAKSPRFGNVPSKYASKHMPAGWWSDQSIVSEGADIYYGRVDRDVKCAKCHGLGGKPVMGARDFSDTKSMKRFSDSHLLWSVTEGVPGSRMPSFKSKLSEEQRWKVIAFIRTFGLDGLRYDADLKQWVPIEGA